MVEFFEVVRQYLGEIIAVLSTAGISIGAAFAVLSAFIGKKSMLKKIVAEIKKQAENRMESAEFLSKIEKVVANLNDLAKWLEKQGAKIDEIEKILKTYVETAIQYSGAPEFASLYNSKLVANKKVATKAKEEPIVITTTAIVEQEAVVAEAPKKKKRIRAKK